MNEYLPVARDVVERVLATFVLTVVGLATADGVAWTDLGSLGNWKAWATAGVVAAFSLIKSLVGTRIGGRSASLAPGVELRPLLNGHVAK